MSYWTHWHNIRHEIDKRIDRLYLNLADRMPRRLRVWVVAYSTNEARKLYPSLDGYAGPDGLGYKEIFDGARKAKA